MPDVSESISIRPIDAADPQALSDAFATAGWAKPLQLFERYVVEHATDVRRVIVAERAGVVAGYVTVLWASPYQPFADASIPEMSDLNVLPDHRRGGVGSRLLDCAEAVAGSRSGVVGLGVGLYCDYGNAQRMYAQRGYVPDGRGLMYDNLPMEPGAMVCIDDDAMLMLTRRVRPSAAAALA